MASGDNCVGGAIAADLNEEGRWIDLKILNDNNNVVRRCIQVHDLESEIQRVVGIVGIVGRNVTGVSGVARRIKIVAGPICAKINLDRAAGQTGGRKRSGMLGQGDFIKLPGHRGTVQVDDIYSGLRLGTRRDRRVFQH